MKGTKAKRITIKNTPPSIEQLRKAKSKRGFLSICLAVELTDIVNNDASWLRERISYAVTGTSNGFTDIGIAPFGMSKNPKVIVISATGNVNRFLAAYREKEEQRKKQITQQLELLVSKFRRNRTQFF